MDTVTVTEDDIEYDIDYTPPERPTTWVRMRVVSVTRGQPLPYDAASEALD